MPERKKAPADYDPSRYERPSVTVDVILFTVIDDELHVLLIKRGNLPFKDYWAFPGGFIEMHERLAQSAVRELREETGIRLPQKKLHFLTVADDPNRDPRTRVIGNIYYAFAPMERLKPEGKDDAAEARFFPVAKLPRLAFDHRKLLNKALAACKERLVLHPGFLEEIIPCGIDVHHFLVHMSEAPDSS